MSRKKSFSLSAQGKKTLDIHDQGSDNVAYFSQHPAYLEIQKIREIARGFLIKQKTKIGQLKENHS